MMSIKRYRDGDYLPLNRYDFVRKTDQHPQRQDGAGVIGWVVVCFLLWALMIWIAAGAGYFN